MSNGISFTCGNKENSQPLIAQIAELEHKLAEKDAELEKWSTQYANAYVNRQNALIAEKVELQHQLAEKDKEIEKLNDCVDFYKSYYISFNDKVIDEFGESERVLVKTLRYLLVYLQPNQRAKRRKV